MLLRSLTKHVKDQNWFAVALDFFIVVAGILIAFQITNWNEARVERTEEQMILSRLVADFDELTSQSNQSAENHRRNVEGMQFVVETIDAGKLDSADLEKFKSGLRNSYTHDNSTGRSSTYREILGSGKVSLIRDEGLRKALVSYDDIVLESAEVFTQIRMHQSAHIQAFTRHFDYAVPFQPITPDGARNFSPIGGFDLAPMLQDKDFKNSAHELREAQRYYYSWHLRAQIRAERVKTTLEQILKKREIK